MSYSDQTYVYWPVNFPNCGTEIQDLGSTVLLSNRMFIYLGLSTFSEQRFCFCKNEIKVSRFFFGLKVYRVDWTNNGIHTYFSTQFSCKLGAYGNRIPQEVLPQPLPRVDLVHVLIFDGDGDYELQSATPIIVH